MKFDDTPAIEQEYQAEKQTAYNTLGGRRKQEGKSRVSARTRGQIMDSRGRHAENSRRAGPSGSKGPSLTARHVVERST